MKTIKILKYKIVIFALLVFSSLNFLTVKTQANPLLTADSQINFDFDLKDHASDERDIFKLVNKQREKFGLDGLQWNEDLEKLAEAYSIKMAREHFFSHFEKNGADVADRAKARQIKYWSKIGENLFMANGYKSFNKFAVDKWMISPGHRQNILDPGYTETGIGIAESSDGTVYVTQVFIKR